MDEADAEQIEVGDWVEPHSRDLDPREVAKVEGDKLWLYILTDEPQGPFPVDNYVVTSKRVVTPEPRDYPDVTDQQRDLIDRYGSLLTNTGGQDPRVLLQRLHDEKYLASTNVVVFVLATAVLSQLSLLAVMDEKGLLTRDGSE